MATQGRYTLQEDERLRGLVEMNGAAGHASWTKISELMPNRTVHSCRMRWKQALRHEAPPAGAGVGEGGGPGSAPLVEPPPPTGTNAPAEPTATPLTASDAV